MAIPHSWLRVLAILSVALGAAIPGCRSHGRNDLPSPTSDLYARYTSSFYQGLAGLQIGDDDQAEKSLSQATQLVPGEPAAWIDWGILALRQRTYDQASDRLHRAHALAPQNDQIEYLQGLLESERGNSAAAIQHLQQAVQSNPKNLRALYALASEIERQGDPGSERRFQQLIQQSLTIEPGNIAALLELSRIAAKRGDSAALHQAVDQLKSHTSSWPPDAIQQLAQLQLAANSPEPRSAATRSIFLRNVLMQLPQFRADLSQLKPDAGEGAQPATQFLRLPNLSARPSPPDRAISFSPSPQAGRSKWDWAGAIYLNGDGPPILAQANATKLFLASDVSLPFPGGRIAAPPTPESILPIDFNFDFRTDLVLAGAGGVRFFRQDNPSTFTDVSSNTKLPTNILNAPYAGAWALDIEADGDLDILLGSETGAPLLLRNNGDGTFTPMHPFSGISGVQQLAWIDLNGDGNPDAAIIDGAGKLHVFLNQRSGHFIESALPGMPSVKAISVADAASHETLDLVAVQSDGNITRISYQAASGRWSVTPIAQIRNLSAFGTNTLRLFAADIDNNGAVDLLLSSVGPSNTPSELWLQNEQGSFDPVPASSLPPHVFALADLRDDGRLSPIGIDNGQVTIAANHGTKNYHWQTIRPRAKVATGDQRINSFGIGGEIEIRSALLLQKQPITSPALHFGLGEHKQTDVARILWPNGSLRAEFNLKSDQQVVTEQRLKGSCPFLFAWNGSKMDFVKDSVPWGSAIGLRINALGAAKIAATEEWYKIGRDQLKPHNGFYDLSITGELWESYYYDSMALMTVDHPIGTEIFTDERYDVPPVKLAVTTTSEPQPITSATDDNGNDVTAILSKLDGNYLDNFGRGQYQGVTRDHYVEIQLPASLPENAPLYLIAKGWLHPSDSSINVAISQGSSEKPHWLSLEVPDNHGGWRTANPNLGFPAGRNKICLINLSDVFLPGTPHRLRLRTNLEIYWDSIEWAQAIPSPPLKIQKLLPSTADLHYRGFSSIHQANASSPEIPDYAHLSGTSQRWRDLEGYYTRYGDVRELLSSTDDRYVIMNAGDEMSLQYPVPAPPPPGWVRDFVIAGDGWIKDGDYNSTYSQTVSPYPYHGRRDYNAPPNKLEDDYVYRHHSQDWQTFHTRYVTPDTFLNALRCNTPVAKIGQ